MHHKVHMAEFPWWKRGGRCEEDPADPGPREGLRVRPVQNLHTVPADHIRIGGHQGRQDTHHYTVHAEGVELYNIYDLGMILLLQL